MQNLSLMWSGVNVEYKEISLYTFTQPRAAPMPVNLINSDQDYEELRFNLMVKMYRAHKQQSPESREDGSPVWRRDNTNYGWNVPFLTFGISYLEKNGHNNINC